MALAPWPHEPSPSRPLAAGGTASIGAAAEALYRACHLRRPAVLVARDGVHFARLACDMSRGQDIGARFIAGYVAALLVGLAAAFSGSVFAAEMLGLNAVLSSPWMRQLHREERQGTTTYAWPLWQGLWLVLLGGSVLGAAWLFGADGVDAARAAGIAVGGVVALQMLSDLLTPVLTRARLRRVVLPGGARLHWSTLVRGAPLVTPIILARLAGAVAEVGAGSPVWPRLVRGADRDPAPARVALLGWITAELRRRRGWQAPAPVLGRALGISSPTWWVNAPDVTVPEHACLPRLLRAAAELDRLAEAVCVLDGAVVVLPLGAAAVPALGPAPSGTGRRSRRTPWCNALAWLDHPRTGLLLALDLAPTDAAADRLLARRLVRLPEACRRTPALQALGLSRVAVALRLRPVQEDAAGQLHQLGRREDPSVFVAVRDRVLGADGSPVEHWISVPPHVATAREAVAWSFGLGEADYEPSRET